MGTRQCLHDSYKRKTNIFLCPESKLVPQCFHCRMEERAPQFNCFRRGKKSVIGCPGKVTEGKRNTPPFWAAPPPVTPTGSPTPLAWPARAPLTSPPFHSISTILVFIRSWTNANPPSCLCAFAHSVPSTSLPTHAWARTHTSQLLGILQDSASTSCLQRSLLWHILRRYSRDVVSEPRVFLQPLVQIQILWAFA